MPFVNPHPTGSVPREATQPPGTVPPPIPASAEQGTDAASREPWAQLTAELEAENQELRAEVVRYRHLLDSATGYAIVTLDTDGQVTGWNESARAILGYSDAEILGRSGELFFPAEDRDKGDFRGELRRAAESGRAPNERWHIRRDGSRFWASGAMMPLLDGDGRLEGFLNIMRDNTEIRAEEERRALLLSEMDHRMKNVLATVQAVATQTLRHAGVARPVQDTLAARLVALARSQDLLARGGGDGTSLAEVVGRALSPYNEAGRMTVDGPPVLLPAAVVEMLNLAFHELATNAAKHGALSAPEGRVEVFWTLRRSSKCTQLVEINWCERDGPPLLPPTRQGFGSQLLEQWLARKLGGTVKLDYQPQGLEVRICLPVATDD